MIFYLIPSVIIFICFSVIIFILYKNFSALSAINVESIVQEKEAKVKNRIILERLTRNYLSAKRFVLVIFKPIWESIQKTASDFYQKIIELERKNINPQPLSEIDIHQQTKDKLEEVNKLILAGELDKAENACVAIVKLDSRNLDVYKLLTDIYLEQKEYKKARETCRYLLKLLTKNKSKINTGDSKYILANCYADLGWIYQLEGRNTYALSNFEKAVGLESNNPRFLDLLLKISIILKNKKSALQAFSSLREADPENQKLTDLKVEIDNLPDSPENLPL